MSIDDSTRKPGFFARLKSGLSRSASGLSDNIAAIFTKRKLDAEAIKQLEEALIRSDLGASQAAQIAAAVGKGRYDEEISDRELRSILAQEIARALKPIERPFEVERSKAPFVVLVAGVNGTGKTTT